MENAHSLPQLILQILDHVFNLHLVRWLIKINWRARVDLMLVSSIKLSLMELQQHHVNPIPVPQNNKAHNVLQYPNGIFLNTEFVCYKEQHVLMVTLVN